MSRLHQLRPTPPEAADMSLVGVELLVGRLVHAARQVIPMRVAMCGVAPLRRLESSDVVRGGETAGTIEGEKGVQAPRTLLLGLLDGTERPGRDLHPAD